MEQYEIYPIQDLTVSFNNVVIFMLIAASVVPLISRLNNDEVVPTSWGVVNESIYKSVLNIVHDAVGIKAGVYFPLIYTLFYTILFSNLIGMVPYSYTPTVQLIFTLAQGVTLLGGIFILGALRHKLLLFGYFSPAGTPFGLVPLMVFIEIIGYLSRTFSQGQRLSVNMITGHIQVKVFSGFIWLGFVQGLSLFILTLPLFILTIFLALELLIAYLQAYIFTFITCITLKDLI